MTCYNPKLRVEMIGKWEKAADGHLYHPAQIIPCDNQQELLENTKKFNANYKKTVIPCRKCIGCRIDYSRDWANRGYLESKKSPNSNYFVTLTYDDEHLPKKMKSQRAKESHTKMMGHGMDASNQNILKNSYTTFDNITTEKTDSKESNTLHVGNTEVKTAVLIIMLYFLIVLLMQMIFIIHV